MNLMFIVNSLLLGAGLAMDAFSVSITNGLVYHRMTRGRRILIASVFAAFQFLMPLTGWFLVRSASTFFKGFHSCIPWIALILLGFIGGSMLLEGIREAKEEKKEKQEPEDEKKTSGHPLEKENIAGLNPEEPGLKMLLFQGIATSIDALSVGFMIVDYHIFMAFVASAVIGAVTFAICIAGVNIGRVFGDIVGSKAKILGGIILIGIGIEIFVQSIL